MYSDSSGHFAYWYLNKYYSYRKYVSIVPNPTMKYDPIFVEAGLMTPEKMGAHDEWLNVYGFYFKYSQIPSYYDNSFRTLYINSSLLSLEFGVLEASFGNNDLILEVLTADGSIGPGGVGASFKIISLGTEIRREKMNVELEGFCGFGLSFNISTGFSFTIGFIFGISIDIKI